MSIFETGLIWKQGRQATLGARDNPALEVATPPEFGGPARTWCPEELFVASVESCLMSTFLYFVDRFQLSLARYSSRSKGILNKAADGLRFSGVESRIEVAWADAAARQKADSLRLKEKLEKYCPVSASLSCPVSIQIIVRESTGDGGERGSDRS